jgi:uncharacterized protein
MSPDLLNFKCFHGHLPDSPVVGSPHRGTEKSVEIIAAITRRERGGTLTPAGATTARQSFRSDLATTYQVIEVTPALADRAMLFAEKHGLRGYDAIQLAAGLEVHVR